MTGGIETAVGHWAQLMEGLQESPKHFYSAIAEGIKRREIPGCEIYRAYWREGGRTSAKREYLRAERGEDLVDICGAPFGNAFFASEWSCIPPPSIVRAVVIVILGLVAGYYLLLGLLQMHPMQPIIRTPDQLDQIRALLALLGLDLLLTTLVVILGIIRPLYFPPQPTYYRIDTAQMFHRAVHNAVAEVIQSLRAEQGLRLLTEDELKPIMRGFGR